MRRLLCIVLLASLLSGANAFGKGTHSSSAPKTVHVHSYTRKDGTVVRAHDRAAPGTATYYKRGHVADGYTLHPSVERDSHGKIKRSRAAREAFIALSSLPS